MKQFQNVGKSYFNDEVKCLERALQWVSSIIEINPASRFFKYKAVLQEYVSSFDVESGTISVEAQKKLIDKYGVNEFYSALFESEELYECYLTFEHQAKIGKPVNIPQQLLSEAVSGVTSDVEEKRNNNTGARNKLFELYCAAHLCASGYFPKLDEGDNADIVFNGHGFKAYAECKRVTSEKRLEANITKASEQLKKRYKNHLSVIGQKPIGIIFLSLSQMIIPPTHLVYINSLSQMKTLANNYTRKVENYINFKKLAENTIAIGTYYRLQGQNSISGQIFSLRTMNFDPLIDNSNPYYKFYPKIAEKIVNGNPIHETK